VKKLFLLLTLFALALLTGAGLYLLAWLLGWTPWVAGLGPFIFLVLPGLYFLVSRLLAWREKRLYVKNVLNQEPALGPGPLAYNWLSDKWALFEAELTPATRRSLRGQSWILALTEPSLAGPSHLGPEEAVTLSLHEGTVLVVAPGFVVEDSVVDLAFERLGSFLHKRAPQGLGGLLLHIPLSRLDPAADRELAPWAALAGSRIRQLYQKLDQCFPVSALVTGLSQNPRLAAATQALESSGQPVTRALPLGSDPETAVAAALETWGELFKDLFYQGLAQRGPQLAGASLLAQKALQSLTRPLTTFLTQLTRPSPGLPAPLVTGLGLAAPPADLKTFADLGPNDSFDSASPAGRGPALPGQSLAQKRLLSQARREGPGLTRPLGLPGSPREKRLTWAFAGYCATLLLVCLGFLVNVQRNREMAAIFRANPDYLARAAPTPALEASAALDLAFSQSRFLTRLTQARQSQFLPGLGRDRGQLQLEAARTTFFQGFAAISLALEKALASQASDESDEASRLTTLRQLLWLVETHRLGLAADWPALERRLGELPAWPADLKGPSQPFWNLVFGELLVNYLKLQPPRPLLLRSLNRLELLILRATPHEGSRDLGWLIKLASSLPESRPLSLAEGAPEEILIRLGGRAQLAEVTAAYTRPGRTAILSALGQLAQIQRYPETFGPKAEAFLAEYERDYLAKWRAFGLAAAESASRLTRPGESRVWLDNCLRLMSENLTPSLAAPTAPAFVRNLGLETAQALLRRRARPAGGPTSGALAGLLERADHLAADLTDLKDLLQPRQYNDSDLMGRILTAAQPYQDFHAALAQISLTTLGRPTEALALAKAHFGGPGHGDLAQSPFTAAATALERYLAYFYLGPEGPEGDPVRALVRAQLTSHQRRLVQETAQALERLWETEVVAPTRYLSQTEARQALFSPNGLLDKFLADQAAPFLAQRGLTYEPASWDGERFPFTEDFLRLLTVGRLALTPLEPIKDSYVVKITALAASVNPEARERPQKTVITLKSPQGDQTLENLNYPVSQAFNFKPGSSGAVEVTIALPSLTLSLTYDGPDAFAYFLKDIMSGELVLTRGDFPQEAEILASLGLERIRLSLELEGALPVIRLVELAEAPSLPTSIIRPEALNP
jgi:type VI secretion system protein ImpL